MTEVDYYDRSDWQLCAELNCPNLFTDGCQGPTACAAAAKRAEGVQIYVVLENRARYVTTIAKKH